MRPLLFPERLRRGPRRQRGVIMVIALITLAVLLIGAAAAMRSMNVTLASVGYFGFKRDMTNQAELGLRHVGKEPVSALFLGDGQRQHAFDVTEREARRDQQVHHDALFDLALNEQFVVEDQRVERRVDGSFDGVFDRHERGVDLAPFDRGQRLGHHSIEHQFAGREIGFAEERLLREGRVRSEKSDAVEVSHEW